MSGRESFLDGLRRNMPPAAPLPELPAAIRYEDPEKQFAEAFTSVGGKFVRVASVAEIEFELSKLDQYARARRIASLVPGISRTNFDLDALTDPHELEGLDFAIIAGELGVAENGAVWVPGSALGPHRAIFVITQHLALVLGTDKIVNTMHEAYERVRFERPGFGTFISGPSKTADIEQSLVIGAHGARSCTLFLVG